MLLETSKSKLFLQVQHLFQSVTLPIVLEQTNVSLRSITCKHNDMKSELERAERHIQTSRLFGISIPLALTPATNVDGAHAVTRCTQITYDGDNGFQPAMNMIWFTVSTASILAQRGNEVSCDV